MFELIKKSLEKYKLLDKDVWFVTLTSSDSALNRNIEHDFLTLWCRMRKVCPNAECLFVVVEGDGVVRPHVHCLVINFYYPKEWFEKQWSLVHGHCVSHLHKSPVDFKRSVSLAVYFSSQHGIVSEVNCSLGWCQNE
jgi:hypothetical protein